VFEIVYDEEVIAHLNAIERKYHTLIQETIEQQLRYQPEVPTRNRKPLRQPAEFGATWEIRFGPDNRFRVFYRIDEEQRVRVLAIGTKERNRLWVGGKEIQL
jgi:mRNA-degrading endonuclease RelE of RelBE toxin-antitoxin system